MSDTIKLSVRYKKEATYGVDPGGNYTEMRIARAQTVETKQNYIEGDEYRTDGNIVSVDRTAASVLGDIDTNISASTQDNWFEYGLRADATWAGAATVATNSAASSDNSFNSTAAYNSTTHAAGNFIVTTGWATSTNNGIWLITQFSSTSKIIVVGANAITTESSGSHNVIVLDSIKNGTTLVSQSIEFAYTDVTNVFSLWGGQCISSFDVGQIDKKKFIGAKFSFMGQDEQILASTSAGTFTVANTNPLVQGVDHVHFMAENGVRIDLAEIGFKVDNGLRLREDQVGTLNPISVGQGDCKVTGKGRVYFSTVSSPLYAKFINNTITSLAIALKDANGKGYCFNFPYVRITTGKRDISAKNQDVFVSFDFQAFMHPTLLYTAKFARLP